MKVPGSKSDSDNLDDGQLVLDYGSHAPTLNISYMELVDEVELGTVGLCK